MSVTTDRVAQLVAPVVERLGLHLYDIDQPGGTLRVMLEREGGVDVDTLAAASREISRALDEADPIAGSYTLEVSSPGLERPLRTAAHFAGAVGEQVRVKLRPEVGGDRRADGTLIASDATTATVDTEAGSRVVRIDDVSKAHTVFVWDRSGAPSRRGPAAPTTESNEESR